MTTSILCSFVYVPLLCGLFGIAPAPALVMELQPSRDPAGRSPSGPVVADTGSIRGTVMSETGHPLRRARVQLVVNGNVDPRQAAITDTRGRYLFANLAPGTYGVAASKAGFVALQSGQRNPFEIARTVQIHSPGGAANLDITLPRGSAIVGRLVDEEGEPIVDATVTLLRHEYVRGARRLAPVTSGWGRAPSRTDDEGQFRLAGLAPGDYVVSATVNGTFADADDSRRTFAYARTYYPGVVSQQEAQAVRVRGGEHVSIGFAMIPARLVRIAGSVVDSAGRPLSGGFARLARSGDSSPQLLPLGADGAFELETVIVPGTYTLTAMAGQAGATASRGDRERGQVTLALGETDVPPIQVTTTPGSIVTGEIVFEAGASVEAAPRSTPSSAASRRPAVRISARPIEPDAVPMNDLAAVSTDGRFELRNVFGRALIAVELPRQSPWSVKGVYLAGEDVTDEGVDAERAPRIEGLRVVLTQIKTQLAGTVRTAERQAADATVVVFSAQESKWRHPLGRYLAVVRAERDGRFAVNGLPPGEYLAAAVDALDLGASSDPDMLARLRPRATAITLGTGATKGVDLTTIDH